MVNVNVWFAARSRSTALMRCISNIPGTKILFEKFLWTVVNEADPALIAELGIDIPPDFTYDNVLKQHREDSSKFKVTKDFLISVKDEDFPYLMSEDSVNIFLARDPALVATSWLPTASITYYEVLQMSHLHDLTAFYTRMRDGIKFVKQNCKKPPLILPGTLKVSFFSNTERSVNSIAIIVKNNTNQYS